MAHLEVEDAAKLFTDDSIAELPLHWATENVVGNFALLWAH